MSRPGYTRCTLSFQRDSAVFELSVANGRLVFQLLKMLISNADDDDDDDDDIGRNNPLGGRDL